MQMQVRHRLSRALAAIQHEAVAVVQPELLREGRLVEVIPKWRFRTFDLSVVHLGNRHIPRPVRVFKEFAAQMAPTLFPGLPA